MKNINTYKGWQEKYYDGEVDYVDEDLVNPEWKMDYLAGIYDDCTQEDDEVLWLKREAQFKYYREPHKEYIEELIK